MLLSPSYVPGSHLSEGDISVREDAAQVVGEPAEPGDVASPLHPHQAHCRTVQSQA